ncbi:Arginine-hydroxylase NDUFAF5, mitochondrial [Porphyridium purpureum]|uniref:Arginine-hydroxylase NDUFAF5, mitochondrial n=1 Tax=Porphyridium purpureum TaxID=35688 RepID=A0A5J4Z966_PORPP|nr:Arginine-hydroxylase NDUFAF5, mitochondrial [Porphyridium purpureum]|eukprot:POR8401..scf295_1
MSVPASLKVFDRSVKLAQRSRAARSPNASDYFYLRKEIADRLTERLLDITKPLPRILDVGCGAGAFVAQALNKYQPGPSQRPHCEKLLCTDASNEVVRRAQRELEAAVSQAVAEADAQAATEGASNTRPLTTSFETQFEVLDEGSATFADRLLQVTSDAPFDAVLSCMNLHWVNDLGSAFNQLGRLLKPDGVFLGAMLGGETLRELRVSMQLAEEEVWSGVSPHVSPMVQVQDVAPLLSNHAGLTMCTVDTDVIEVTFQDFGALMRHLQGMGENNCALGRRTHFGRRAFKRAEEIYKERFGSSDEGYITASFMVVYMIGWKPHELQPKPARRGSQQFSLRDLSELSERVPGGFPHQ